MWVVHNSCYSCKWVDDSENYQLKNGEYFSETYPDLQQVPEVKKELVDQIIDDPIQLSKLKAALEK